jgi:hypothetical protein
MGSFQSTLFDPRVGVTLFHINVNVRLAPDGKSVALLGYFLWYAKIQRPPSAWREDARDGSLGIRLHRSPPGMTRLLVTQRIHGIQPGGGPRPSRVRKTRRATSR